MTGKFVYVSQAQLFIEKSSKIAIQSSFRRFWVFLSVTKVETFFWVQKVFHWIRTSKTMYIRVNNSFHDNGNHNKIRGTYWFVVFTIAFSSKIYENEILSEKKPIKYKHSAGTIYQSIREPTLDVPFYVTFVFRCFHLLHSLPSR